MCGWRKDSSAVFLFFTEASFLKAKARQKNEDSSLHTRRENRLVSIVWIGYLSTVIIQQGGIQHTNNSGMDIIN